MCPRLQGDETLRYLCKCLLHRFRCHRPFLLQKDFSRFIQNAVARPVIAKVQTNRELVSFENRVLIYPNGASLFHSRSPFLLRHERVEHWERIASRGRPAFSSHLVIAEAEFSWKADRELVRFCVPGARGRSEPAWRIPSSISADTAQDSQ